MTQLASNPESRMWAMLAHVGALLWLVLPFGHIVGPLMVWLLKKDEMPFVDDQAKEALNFNITMTIYMFVAIVSVVFVIGFLLIPLVGLFGLVCSVIAGTKANEGIAYRYPLTIRFIR